mgnify:CR=1 FL=1
MEFNERLRTIRKEHGLTQAELAEKAGIAVNSVRLYESGKVIPKLDTIARIARAMGLTASDFVGGQWGKFQGGFCSEEEVQQDDREARLIYYFQNLNEKGQATALDRLEELTQLQKYQRRIELPKMKPDGEE